VDGRRRSVVSVTSVTSLFGSPAAEITLDRVQALVDQTPEETLTVEYKREYTRQVVTSVAAMANTYGGLILVGVTEEEGDDRLVGVPLGTVDQIVNGCHDLLEPPWHPEIITLPLPGQPEAQVIVLRVDPARAPRPLLVKGAAPIRLHGRNAVADRSRLAQLFTVTPASVLRPAVGEVPLPMMPTPRTVGGWPEPLTDDFVLRSGLMLPVEAAATWLPLSETAVDRFILALNHCAIRGVLGQWGEALQGSGPVPFRQSGLNRSHHLRLVSEEITSGGEIRPAEAVAVVHLPDGYGTPKRCHRSRRRCSRSQPHHRGTPR